MTIDITKAKLQKALQRLEEVIDHKIHSMEYEIASLKAENSKLKALLKKAQEPQPSLQEIKTNEPPVTKRSVSKESKIVAQQPPPLLNPKVVQDIDQTISRLKRLVE